MTTLVTVSTPDYPIDVRVEFETLTPLGWTRDEAKDEVLGAKTVASYTIHASVRISGIYEVETSKLHSAADAA